MSTAPTAASRPAPCSTLERRCLAPDADQVSDLTAGREAVGEHPAEPAVRFHRDLGSLPVHDAVGLVIQVEVDDPDIRLELDAPALDVGRGESVGEHHTLQEEVDPEHQRPLRHPEAIGGGEDVDQLDGELIVVEVVEVVEVGERTLVSDERNEILDRPGSLTQKREGQIEDPPIVRVQLILQHRLTLAGGGRRRNQLRSAAPPAIDPRAGGIERDGPAPPGYRPSS